MSVTIGRRELPAALGGVAGWPLAARAQQLMPVIQGFATRLGLRFGDISVLGQDRMDNLLKISVSREVALVFGHHEGPTPTRGYEATRWRRFPKSWRRAAGADRVPGKGRSSTTLPRTNYVNHFTSAAG